MADEKKNDDDKTTAPRKATTGAWWKSTVTEESGDQPPAPAKPAENEAAPADEAKPAKAPRKRASKKAPAAPVDGSAEGSETAAPQPRKRAPRKKKEPVVAEGSASVEAAAVEPVSAGTPEAQAGEGASGDESAPATKRPARKRPSRSKKKAAEPVAEAVADLATPPAEASSEAEAAAPASAEATVPVDGETPPDKPKRSGRKRSRRKKKSSETAGTRAENETKEQTGETTGSGGEGTAAAAAESAEESTGAGEGQAQSDEETGREPKKRRSRRSRNRRKKPAKPVEEATADSAEPEDDEDDWSAPVDDDDAFAGGDDDGDDDDLFSRDDGDDYDDDDHDGADIPELPDDEPEDEQDRVVLKLLINAEEPEECRLALLANGRLESIHVSTINRTQTKNNIYKARIVAIEPNLQAAFVDYGTEKNGFLPFSEIHPEYYREDLSDEIRRHVENHHWKKLSITDVVEKGQEVLVQVVKEEVGKKGANMTTYLSLPGRSVVLMPGSDSSGISRKISGEERRAQLRTAMNSLEIPEGIGWIVRTASADITRSALARDVSYLLRLWEEIKKKAQDLSGVGQVYEDHQSVLRFLREHFDPNIEEILVDDETAMEQVKEFISYLPAKQRDVKVRLHKGSRPIFNQFSVEDQIESIYQPRVALPSGGSIVIEPTEALVSIDVNSGSTSKGKNFEQSIFQANLEAAAELARQLRLRDLGGLIVVDFIDMRNKKHVRDVERMVKQSMRRDKAKVDFTRISKFGLMQISRQKLGSPIEAGNYRVCQHCKGRGTVRSVETLALFYLRRIQTGASRKHVGRVECRFPLDVAQYLLNKKRYEIQEHESRYETEIVILADPNMGPTEHDITLHKPEKEVPEKKQG